MNQTILLFLQRDIEDLPTTLLSYIYLIGIITYTYTRNKRIAQNRATSSLFILSGNAEKTKRIKIAGRILQPNTHTRTRYMNTSDYKVQNKNAYQGVITRKAGGNRA